MFPRFPMTTSCSLPSQSFGGEVDGDHRRDGLEGGSIVTSHHCSPRTPCFHFDPLPADDDGVDRGGVHATQQAASADSLRPPDAGFWRANIRRPRAGERVQVKHNFCRAVGARKGTECLINNDTTGKTQLCAVWPATNCTS